MADRTYNALDVDLWDKDWPELAIVAAAMLIGICPNKQGIFDFPGGRLRRFLRALGASEDEISAAILKLVEVELIKFYREGKLVWIVKKFKREAKWVKTVKQREGVRSFIANFPEVEIEFQAMYGALYLEPLGVMDFPNQSETGLKADKIVPIKLPIEVATITSETDTETEVVSLPTKRKKRETTSNKLRAPTERERSLFHVVDKLGGLVNAARLDLGLAAVEQDQPKAAVVLRQCEDHHNLTPKELAALADWMFHAKNKDRLFNVQNMSLIHNWRKPWTNGTAIIIKWEEFVLWLKKQQTAGVG
jgi:hypothetical protein